MRTVNLFNLLKSVKQKFQYVFLFAF